MKYELKIGDATHTLEISAPDDQGQRKVEFGEDKSANFSSRVVSNNEIILDIDGVSRPVYVVQEDQGMWIWCDGRARFVADAAVATRRKRSSGTKTPDTVTPPTPAVVISVLVEQDQEVTKGQGVVVVSAMKLETTLSAPYDGVVKSINTEVGAKVSPGDILIDIERSEEPDKEQEDG